MRLESRFRLSARKKINTDIIFHGNKKNLNKTKTNLSFKNVFNQFTLIYNLWILCQDEFRYRKKYRISILLTEKHSH